MDRCSRARTPVLYTVDASCGSVDSAGKKYSASSEKPESEEEDVVDDGWVETVGSTIESSRLAAEGVEDLELTE